MDKLPKSLKFSLLFDVENVSDFKILIHKMAHGADKHFSVTWIICCITIYYVHPKINFNNISNLAKLHCSTL